MNAYSGEADHGIHLTELLCQLEHLSLIHKKLTKRERSLAVKKYISLFLFNCFSKLYSRLKDCMSLLLHSSDIVLSISFTWVVVLSRQNFRVGETPSGYKSKGVRSMLALLHAKAKQRNILYAVVMPLGF